MGRDFCEADPAARELFELTSERCGRDLRAARLRRARRRPSARTSPRRRASTSSRRWRPGLSGSGESSLPRPPATASETTPRWSPPERSPTRRLSRSSSPCGARPSGPESAGRWARSSAPAGRRSRRSARRLRERGLQAWIGNVNASTQFVLTGSAEGVAAALEALRPRALSVLPLTMSWPIHSELMRPVAEAIAPMIAGLSTIRDPAVPVLRAGGPRGRGRRGSPASAGQRVLLPDALEGHVRGDDGGRPPPLPGGGTGRHAHEDGAVDRSFDARHSGGHRVRDRGGRGYSRGRMKNRRLRP